MHVRPRAGRSGILGRRPDGTLLVALRAAPEGGAANAELVQLLARSLHVPRSAVSIVQGASTRQKQVRIEGTTAAAWSNLAPFPGSAPVARTAATERSTTLRSRKKP